MFYCFIKVCIKLYLKVFYGIEVKGMENLPKNSGYIICSNHTSALDPLAIGVSLKSKIHFMAKEELFKNKFKAWFFRSVGAFPVRRGTADITAIKTAINLLKDGKVFGIFPQGTRTNSSTKPQSGIAMIALKAQAPIVPIGISSNYKLFNKITITIGKPIDLSVYYKGKVSGEQLDVISKNVMRKINDLM